MSTPSSCDVAIIGAGIGGLTAAAILAKAGCRVIVFESSPHPGGYLAAFERKGFRFDTSVQWLTQYRPEGFLFRIHEFLGGDHPHCRTLHRIHRYKTADRDYLLTVEPHRFRDALLRDFPHESRGIDRLFQDAEMLGRHMRFLDSRMRSAATMPFGVKLSHGIAMTRWVWPIRRFATTPAAKGLPAYFRSPELLRLFHSEDTLMSVLVPIGFAFTEDFQMPPKGGASAFIDWLSGKIASAGGVILPSHRVTQILVNERREAAGVVLANGSAVQARYVLGACDVHALLGTMAPDGLVRPRRRKQLLDADIFYSSFCVYLGLDRDPAALGLDEAMIRLTDGTAPVRERIRGEPGTTAITVLAPSFRDPSLAPPGKGTLLIQCPAYMRYENNWRTGPGIERGEAYRQLKQAYANTLLDRVERQLIPGLRQYVEVMEAATPVTFWRYTGNREGSIMGHRPTRHNIRRGLARVDTPVKRLLVGGQWAEYGGGIPMATKAAVNASLLILRDLCPAEFKTLAAVVDRR